MSHFIRAMCSARAVLNLLISALLSVSMLLSFFCESTLADDFVLLSPNHDIRNPKSEVWTTKSDGHFSGERKAIPLAPYKVIRELANTTLTQPPTRVNGKLKIPPPPGVLPSTRSRMKAIPVNTVSLKLEACMNAVTLAPIIRLKKLRWLEIDCWCDKRGPDVIGKLPNLEYLYLRDCDLRHSTWLAIGNLNKLKALHIDSAEVGDHDLGYLSKCSDMQDFTVGIYNHITDAGLKFIAHWSKLQNLVIYSQHITGSGLEYLASLPELQSLVIVGSPKFSNVIVENIGKLHSLRELNLPRANYFALKSISELRSLRLLGLGQITDDGATSIALLSNLAHLNLSQKA